MRIGIDYTAAVNQKAGIGRYTRGLVKALAEIDNGNEYVLFYSRGQKEQIGPFFPDHANFTERSVGLSNRTLAILWHRFQLPIFIERFIGSVDVFHSPDFTLPPMRCKNRVLTVHDVSFLLFPECHDANLREYLEKTVPLSVARSSLVLADSANTLNDVVCLLDVDPNQVEIIYPGVSELFHRVENEQTLKATRDKFDLHFPFILFVGTLEPRKNLTRLIQAYARLKTRGQIGHKLVIGGGKGWLYDEVFQRAVDLRVQDDIIFPGYIPEEDLPSLLSLADLFVFPSLYEGFGLPPLEAMACGTPVVTSRVSSLPEIVSDAALTVNPQDVDELANAIAEGLDNSALRLQLREKGLERARLFTWRAAAEKLLDIYRRLGETE